MNNRIKGTVAAMAVAVGIFASGMPVFAASADEISLHTTQMSFDCEDGKEGHEITDEERQQLRENLAKDAKERRNKMDWDDLEEVAGELTDILMDLIFG